MAKPQSLLHLVLAAGLLGACARPAAEPVGEFRGTIRSGCAPHDALSTMIELESQSSEATVWFNLWPESGVIPPTVIRFHADRNDGQASYCPAGGECLSAAWGEVDLQPGNDGAIHGTWRLGFTETEIEGVFQAEWLLVQALCG